MKTKAPSACHRRTLLLTTPRTHFQQPSNRRPGTNETWNMMVGRSQTSNDRRLKSRSTPFHPGQFPKPAPMQKSWQQTHLQGCFTKGLACTNHPLLACYTPKDCINPPVDHLGHAEEKKLRPGSRGEPGAANEVAGSVWGCGQQGGSLCHAQRAPSRHSTAFTFAVHRSPSSK